MDELLMLRYLVSRLLGPECAYSDFALLAVERALGDTAPSPVPAEQLEDLRESDREIVL